MTAGDDAERSDAEERRHDPPATMQSAAMRRSGAMTRAGDDAERSDAEERRHDPRRRRCRAQRCGGAAP